MNKQVLRKQLKHRRDELSASKRKEAADAIWTAVMAECKQYSILSCYVSFQSEVSTQGLLPKLLERHRVVVPRVVSKTRMEFVEIHDQTVWQRSRYGISEPIDGILVDPSEIDCFLVPLLGFDAFCHRLGYGGGYYDRVLANLSACKIGLAYDEQEVKQVPVGTWDISMDRILTPTRLLFHNEKL